MLLLMPTRAGLDREQQALLDGSDVPAITQMVFGFGQPVDPPSTATDLSGQFHAADILVKEKLSEGAIKLTADIGPDVEGRIREVGLKMADGTLYAYNAYMPEQDGMFKANGFVFRLAVVISRENIGELTIKYEALDVDLLAASVAQKARDAIALDHTSSLIAITRHLSSLNGEVLSLTHQSRLNGDGYV